MTFEVRFTNDPEFNQRHWELIGDLNTAIVNTVHQLYDEGMSVEDIVVALPVQGVTEKDVYLLLDRFWFDSRCRIRRDDLDYGLHAIWVTGSGKVVGIGRNTFTIEYDDGRKYAYDYEALDRHICILPHSYNRVDGSWHHNGIR